MKHTTTGRLLAAAALFLAGCTVPPGPATDPAMCPGKATIAEAVRVLALQRQNVRAFKASADCVVYLPDAEGRLKPESVDAVSVRFVPPENFFFRGDKAFQEIRLGTNDTEFWLRIKPELDSYWYGSKVLADRCREALLINPANIAEALGAVEVTTDWTLFYRDGYDILDQIDNGRKVKRLYVDACTYQVRRIEYFDPASVLKASAELTRYTRGENGIVVPSHIYVTNYDERGLERESIEIILKGTAPFTPTDAQRDKLFARPDRDGYEHVYELTGDCRFEPQP